MTPLTSLFHRQHFLIKPSSPILTLGLALMLYSDFAKANAVVGTPGTGSSTAVAIVETWRANNRLTIADGMVVFVGAESLELIPPATQSSTANCAHVALVSSGPVSLNTSVISETQNSGSLSLFAPSVQITKDAVSLQGKTFSELIAAGSSNLAVGELSFDTTGAYIVATGAHDPTDAPLSGNFSIAPEISEANAPLGRFNAGPAITHNLSDIGRISSSGPTGFEQRNSVACADFSQNPGVGFAMTDSNTAIQWQPVSFHIE